MRRFKYALYEINVLPWDEEEHLRHADVESAHAAIQMCLDPNQKADYLILEFVDDSGEFGEFHPYSTWRTLEKFEELLQNHMLATKVQLNIDLDIDKATEDLILMAIETKNHSLNSNRR